MNKLPLLLLFIDVNKCDILFLSETWLTSNILCSDIIRHGYQLFRADRRNNKRGGGSAILIKNNITASQSQIGQSNDMNSDICCVEVF